MKIVLKRITIVLLSAIILGTSLIYMSSCGKSNPIVMEYNGVTLTADIYEYWTSQYKALLTYTNGYKNTAEFWQSEAPDGRTYEEYLTETIDEYIMNRLICIYLFDSLGYTLSSDTRKDINESLNGLVDSLANGSKSEFNDLASDYGIDYNGIRNALLYEAKVSELYYALYSENGSRRATEDEKDAFYRDNYARVKIVLVRTKNKFVTDKDGNYVLSDDGKTYETEGLTVAERAAKYELIDKIRSELDAGVSFEDILEYSDDPSTAQYSGGFYFTKSTSYVDDIVDVAFELDTGEWAAVESEYGTHFVLKYELDEGAYDVEKNADFFSDFYSLLYSDIFTKDMQALYDEITVYTEEKNKIKLSEVISNWDM